jgi:hypothetical protein
MPELAQLEYDYTLHENRFKGDDKLYVRFFMDIIPDDDATKATGVRKFRDVEMIQIMVPGDKRNVTIRVARDEDKDRFAALYERFQKSQDQEALAGFPLTEWSALSRATIEELKYLGFRSVEHIANASDSVLGKHPGLRELQKRAKTFLEAQASAAPLERLQAELKTRDDAMAGMKAQMEEMAKALAVLNKK